MQYARTWMNLGDSMLSEIKINHRKTNTALLHLHALPNIASTLESKRGCQGWGQEGNGKLLINRHNDE